jgi:hypothetical protein
MTETITFNAVTFSSNVADLWPWRTELMPVRFLTMILTCDEIQRHRCDSGGTENHEEHRDFSAPALFCAGAR